MLLVRRRIRVSRVYRGPLLGRERSMKLWREHAVEAIVSLTFACRHTFTSYPFPFIAHQPGSPCKHITSYAHHAPMSCYFPALTDFHTHQHPSPRCSHLHFQNHLFSFLHIASLFVSIITFTFSHLIPSRVCYPHPL